MVPSDGKDLLVMREKRGYRPDCHIFGRKAAHQNADTMLRIKQYGQEKAMRENGWSVDDFIREFGKNYL